MPLKKTIFVGMLSYDTTEQDVRLMFERFGTVVKCDVLRGANGRSKRCAFVTFTCTDHAAAAVDRMHRSQTIKSCLHPLVVNFADSPTERDQRRRRRGGQLSRPELQSGLRVDASVEQCAQPFVSPANDDVNVLPSEMHRQIGLDANTATGHSTAANNVDLQQHLDRDLLLTNDAAQLNPGPGHVLPNPTFTGYLQNPTLANLSVGNPLERPMMIQNVVPLVASNPISPSESTGSSCLSVPAQLPAQLNPGPGHVQPNPTFTGYPQNPTFANLSVGNPFVGPIMIQNVVPSVASNPILPTGSTGSSIFSVPAQHPSLWPSYAVLSTGTNPFAVQPQPFQAGLPLCYTTRALPIGYYYFNAI